VLGENSREHDTANSSFWRTWNKQLRFDNNEMSFADTEFSDHLASYDIAIYCTGAFKYKHQKGLLGQNFVNPIPPAAAIRRETEIHSLVGK